MPDRKLASIQKIYNIHPIEGADKIDGASILGWHCVVNKNEFNNNDLCVYCEIDSLMPDKPEFKFLEPKKYRIKTIKLKGIISQGICFPLSILPDGVYNEGDDVTDIIGVTKYEAPIPTCLTGVVRGTFPSYVKKTDEERIQTCFKNIIQRPDINDPVWYVTEKLDGTSFTSFIKDDQFHVCSRGMDLKLEDNDSNLYIKTAKMLALEEILRDLKLFDFAIQGEIIGAGVQGNKYKLTDQQLYVFNIFDIDNYKYVNFETLKTLIKNLGLNMVPILDENFIVPKSVDEIIEYSKGPSVFKSLSKREGVVIRHKYEDISFKAINPEFLIKFDE